MEETHKEKLRIARYKALYGERWEEALAMRHESLAAEKQELKGKVKAIAGGDGLSKTEFLKLVAARMRLWTAKPKEFLALAKLYAEVKRWTEPAPERPPTTGEMSANDLIAQLEQLTKDEGNE